MCSNGKAVRLSVGAYNFFMFTWFVTSIHVAEWLERLAANAKFATVLGSIPASSDTVESAGRQLKQMKKKDRKNASVRDFPEIMFGLGIARHFTGSYKPFFFAFCRLHSLSTGISRGILGGRKLHTI
jgi:hypothetical protein